MKTRLNFLTLFLSLAGLVHANAQPAVSAPVPTHPASEVVSVFSDSYTTATNGFIPLELDDCSIPEIITLAGSEDEVIKLPELGEAYARISTWDIESSLSIHMDVYLESGSGNFSIQLSNSYQFTNPKSPEGYSWPAMVQGQWVGVDIPVSAFRDAGLDMMKVLTVMFEGDGTFYVDNIYAYGREEFVAAPTPKYDASEVSCAFSDHYKSVCQFAPQNWTPVKTEIKEVFPGDHMWYIPNLQLGNAPLFVSGWDISDKGIIHMDVYCEDGGSNKNFYFGFGNAWDANDIKYPGFDVFAWPKVVKGKWVSFELTTTALAELGLNLSNVISLRVYGSGTFYVDNVYAYGKPGDEIDDGVEGIALERAPMPTHLPAYVSSAFSDRYETSVTFTPRNQSAKIQKIKRKNDYVLEIPSSLITATVDLDTWSVPANSTIHLDVYYAGKETCEFGFQLAGADGSYKSPVNYTWPVAEVKTWVGIEIPAASFADAGLDLSAIKALKLSGNGPYYIDNIYAYTLPEDDGTFKVRTQFGVNLAGGEFSASLYPTEEADWDYYQEKGLNLIRVPFKWERLQPTLNGPLDETHLGKLKQIAEYARSRGMQLMFDMHNYCQREEPDALYKIAEAKHKNKNADGTYSDWITDATPGVTAAHLADVWKKLAAEFKEYKTWGYDIMNEPYDVDVAVWKATAQEVINAIRTVDTETPIVVEGCSWASADHWITLSDDLKNLTDPSGRIIYQAHCYFDNNASGTFKGSYDEEVKDPQVAIKRLSHFIQWLNDNNKIGMIGELGVPGNDSRWLTMLDEACAYLKQNNVSLTYWAGGRSWGDYALSIHPNVYDFSEEKPQMSVLEKYGDFYTGAVECVEVEKTALQVYPNPVNDVVNVRSNHTIKAVSVYSLVGVLVREAANVSANECVMDLSSLVKGHYLVRVQFENGAVATSKIIKR